MAKLEEICEFKNGLWKSEKQPLVSVTVLRNTNFTKNGQLNLQDVAILDVEERLLKDRLLQFGDIILERSGGGPKQPVGRVAFFNIREARNYSFSNFTTRIRIKDEKMLPIFLWRVLYYFYQKGGTEKLQKQTSGIRNLEFDRYKVIVIPLPPLDAQREIVAEIEGYQKVIDGARQVVENWKPRIKIDPEWPGVKLGELCTFMTGGTPTSTEKKYYENGTIRWLVSGDIHREEIFDCKGRITELGMKSSNAKYLSIDSVLIALNGQGRTRGTVAILRIKATCNQSIVSITPKNKEQLISEFLLYQLKGRYAEIRNLTGDNQRSGLNIPILKNIDICLPKIEEQKNIVAEIQEQQQGVDACKKLIETYEAKIKEKIGDVWGEK